MSPLKFFYISLEGGNYHSNKTQTNNCAPFYSMGYLEGDNREVKSLQSHCKTIEWNFQPEFLCSHCRPLPLPSSLLRAGLVLFHSWWLFGCGCIHSFAQSVLWFCGSFVFLHLQNQAGKMVLYVCVSYSYIQRRTEGAGLVYELHMLRIFNMDCLKADVFDVLKHVHIQKLQEVLGKLISSLHTSCPECQNKGSLHEIERQRFMRGGGTKWKEIPLQVAFIQLLYLLSWKSLP